MEKKRLMEYVRGTVSTEDLLKKLLYLVKKMEEYQQQGKYIVVDSSRIWLSANGQLELEETVVPYNMADGSLDNLFKDIACSAVFQEQDNVEPVIAFLKYLDSSKYFNIVETRRYLETITSQNSIPNEEKEEASVYPEQGETGVLGLDELSAMHLNKMADAAQARFQAMEAPVVPQNNNDGETGVLDESYWETLQQKAVPQMRTPKSGCMLIRVKNNQEIPIHKDIFSVGKEDESVDYVLNNPAVSRRHFDIISKDNHYFIMDNGSTNKTYVDGREIPPKEAVEIKYGVIIKAANEEFLFEVLR